MKFNGIDQYDDFEVEGVFWLAVSDIPQIIQDKAKQIDGEYYNPKCFGICIGCNYEKEEFSIAPDEKDTNIYYVDNDGNYRWYMADLSEEFMSEIIAACKNHLKTYDMDFQENDESEDQEI